MSKTNEKVSLFGIITLIILLVLLGTTNSFISVIKDLDIPETSKINGIGDLTKLDAYKGKLIEYLYIRVFSSIFSAVTGRTVLETLHNIQAILILLFLLVIIVLGFYMSDSQRKQSRY